MSNEIQTNSPLNMVPYLYSLSFLVYANNEKPEQHLSMEQLREHIISQLPPGLGVSTIQMNCHGIRT